jgi:hypothetical protein
MKFAYLNLPKLPEEYVQLCLDKVPLAWSDPKLIELNKKEGISHSISYLPSEVIVWLMRNIVPLIDPVNEHPELRSKMMLHINEYIEHEEGNGVHPMHLDYGRKYAFNYVLTPGADILPTTTWYENDKKTIIEQHQIEAKRWHIIAVNPVWHGVKGQEKDKLRTIVSLCYDPIDLNTFDIRQHFGHLIQ